MDGEPLSSSARKRRHDPHLARAVAAWLCRRHTEALLREVAEWLGLSRADSVPNLTCRLERGSSRDFDRNFRPRLPCPDGEPYTREGTRGSVEPWGSDPRGHPARNRPPSRAAYEQETKRVIAKPPVTAKPPGRGARSRVNRSVGGYAEMWVGRGSAFYLQIMARSGKSNGRFLYRACRLATSSQKNHCDGFLYSSGAGDEG